MPDNNTYKLREQARTAAESADDPGEDTVVLEPGWRRIESAGMKLSPGGLRPVHASLYTMQAYKRWMMQIRESWKTGKH